MLVQFDPGDVGTLLLNSHRTVFVEKSMGSESRLRSEDTRVSSLMKT